MRLLVNDTPTPNNSSVILSAALLLHMLPETVDTTTATKIMLLEVELFMEKYVRRSTNTITISATKQWSW